ncbi:MAG: thioredoxin-dependent thiol peroxidase [Chloroflexi bacterium]|nr:thioredoxin-dependent thiol peroxidase [Chloroflexota bacterium]MCY3581353.1 thioredoxin-dependent thiol peroxidase [Chloroflexota bacterium]MCY3716390.1 thioredoxin-dependent thiol peroxidase [Chloroflexota bacterium]MDE2649410.1 thioredoxin-dependent thiol peroxidase [Chloroflexota bacterium]MXV92145.1 thioredoxin-dependent thiol peroxidase [Chloroflexota bacterium]
MPSAGEIAPDFELKNQHGEAVRLSDYRGKKVLLFAYPKAGTSGCTAQACGFRDNFAQIQTADAVVLGLSPDEPAALARWIQAEKLGYDLLSDPDHEALEAWGAWGERSMYGRKYVGVIRSHWIIGEDGTVLDAQVKISPKKSIEKALKFLARVS